MVDSLRSITVGTSLGDILAASNRLVAQVLGPADGLGLSARQYRVLLLLWEADHLGLSTLAARPGTGTVKTTLDALEVDGYVERDQREGIVRLTEKGRKASATLGSTPLCDRLQALQAELEALRDMLHRAIAQVEKAPHDMGPSGAAA